MPDIAERSTDIGIAQSTAPVAAAAQISAAFLQNVNMVFSVFEWLDFQDRQNQNRQFPSYGFDANQQKF